MIKVFLKYYEDQLNGINLRHNNINKIEMRYILLSLLLPFLCAGQDASDIVAYQAETIHLGEVLKGDKVSDSFVFTNISDQEVEIDIVSTCECTEAKWPHYPIGPGEKATIQFTFDSSQKDEEVPIEVDVYYLNINPLSGNPYSSFLNYTFEWKKD